METNGQKKTQINSKEKAPLTQIFAAVVCNLGQASCGLAVGWISPAIPQIKASGALAGIDQEDVLRIFSWMAGAACLVAVFFTPLSALISEGLGRKKCSVLTAVPFLINSLIIISTSDVYWILAGRFIMGIGIAMSLGNNQVFIGEAVSPSVRGKLSTLMAIAYTSGLLSSYVLGGYVSASAVGYLMLTIAVVNIFLFLFIPETPAWLVKHGKIEEAYKSVAWYRRKNVDDLEVKQEIKLLSDAAAIELPSRIQSMKQLVFSKPIRRGFLICLYATIAQEFTGMIAVHSFSVSIFMQSGSGNLSPEGSTAIYGCLQVLGAASTAFVVDRFGRKFLFASSSASVCLCMFLMAIYFHLQSLDYDLSLIPWLPVVVLSVCVYTYTVGVGSVPFVLLAELLPNEVRSAVNMIVMVIFNLNMFLILFLYERAVTAYGPHPVFYLFGTTSLLTFITSFIIIPETKGKTSEEIMRDLSR